MLKVRPLIQTWQKQYFPSGFDPGDYMIHKIMLYKNHKIIYLFGELVRIKEFEVDAYTTEDILW